MRSLPLSSIALIVALSGSLAACGDTDGAGDEKGPATTHSSGVPSAQPSSDASPAEASPTVASPTDADPAEEWVRTTDASGLSFEFPDEVEPSVTTQIQADGTNATRREYKSEGDQPIRVVITSGTDIDAYDPAMMLATLANQLLQRGNTDVEQFGETGATFGDLEGVDMSITFISRSGVPSRVLGASVTVDGLLVLVLTTLADRNAASAEESFDRVTASLTYS